MPRLKRYKLSTHSLLVSGFFSIWACPTWAEINSDASLPALNPASSAIPEPRRNLKQFLEAAESNGHELAEAKGKIEFAQARESLAQSYGLPSGKVDLFFGPVPAANGNPINGATDWNKWGAFSVARLELIQPVYTFGALSSGLEAAQTATHAEMQLGERARLQLRTVVAELYYGYQLAFELAELTTSIGAKLDEALRSGQQLIEQKRRGAPTAADLDKLRVYIADLQIKTQEAQKAQMLARAAMAWKIGIYGKSEARWDRANLQAVDFRLQDLAHYQNVASEKRPELIALNDDVKAKRALVNMEEGLTLPMLYVAGQFNYSIATQRSDQTSPFAYDPLNDLSGALLLGLRWNLGFERRSKLSMARAELLQAEGRLRHLGVGVQLDVERAYRESKLLFEVREKRDEGSKAAKRVFNDSFVALTLGTGPAKDFLEALGAYGMAEKNRLESIQQANVSLYKLEQAIGAAL